MWGYVFLFWVWFGVVFCGGKLYVWAEHPGRPMREGLMAVGTLLILLGCLVVAVCFFVWTADMAAYLGNWAPPFPMAKKEPVSEAVQTAKPGEKSYRCVNPGGDDHWLCRGSPE